VVYLRNAILAATGAGAEAVVVESLPGKDQSSACICPPGLKAYKISIRRLHCSTAIIDSGRLNIS
jgi:hypothetical protein